MKEREARTVSSVVVGREIRGEKAVETVRYVPCIGRSIVVIPLV